MTFAQFNFNDNVFKAIDYTIPTPIQIGSIPDIMLGKDLVASAPTGTGKTAAFVLPALHRLCLSKSSNKPRILILTPTRELAAQITQGAGKYGKFLKFNIVSLVGGMPYRQQLRELSRNVDVIVATPGRLLDHMDNKRLDLSGIEMLILDEADRMLDMGFIDDVKDIAKATPATRQTLLFSATVDGKLASVIRQLLKDPKRIDFTQKAMAPTLIQQEGYIVDNAQHKNRLLQHFLDNGNIYKAIIFAGTKMMCDQLANDLCKKGYEAAALHGDLRQNVRNKTLEQLRRGKIQFLVATDVAARGIDINDVTHVINYDLPKFPEDYVHRIGRTGRAGRDGIAISLILPLDARHLQKIERYTSQKLELSVVEGLEPTKRLAKSGPDASGGKSRSGKGAPGGYKGKKAPRGSYARNADAPRDTGYRSKFERGSDKPRGEFRGDFKRGADKPRGEFRSDFKRSDDKPRGEFRSDFKRRDDKPRGEFRSDFKRGADKPRGEFRGGFKRDDDKPRSEFRSGFKRNDDKPRGEFRSGFKRDDDKPRSEFRSSSKRNDDKPRGEFRTGFKRDDDKPRSEFRSGFKRNDDKPRGEFRSGFKRNDDKPRSEARGRFKRDDDKPRRSFTPRDDAAPRRESRYGQKSQGDTPRSTDPRVSYGKTTGGRNKPARNGFGRQGAVGAGKPKRSPKDYN